MDSNTMQKNATTECESLWFRTTPERERLNIICIPFAAGDATVYSGLSKKLYPQAAIHPAHLPGRGTRFGEPCITDMDLLVDSLIDGMTPFAGLRYAVLGASMGAWIGLHVCQRLSAGRSSLPEALIVCAASSPLSMRRIPRLSSLSDAVALDVLLKFNPNLARLLAHSELIELFLPVLRSDFHLCERWTPTTEQILTIPIFAFAGINDEIADLSSMRCWSQFTSAGFNLKLVHGGHFFVQDPADDLVDELSSLLGLPTPDV